MELEFGFYSVKLFKGDEWSVGQYRLFHLHGEEKKLWYLIGDDGMYETSELFEVGRQLPVGAILPDADAEQINQESKEAIINIETSLV